MNHDEELENRLAQVPQQPMPPAWREDILSTARAAAARPPKTVPSRMSVRAALAAWLWPHPTAWAGLGAAWLLIFALTLAGRDPAQTEVVRGASPPSRELRALLRQQEQFFAELTGPPHGFHPAPPRPAQQPRSERPETSLNT